MIGASSVNPTSACAALCTETPPATGVPGWVMEWNRIGRSHVYFAKCHGDGPEMMKICEVLALLLFAALTPEVVSANQQERNGSAVADFQNVADMNARDVYTAKGERIGELSEIVLDEAHRPIAALIETDEGTGTGGEEHAVGAEKLWLKGTRLITNLTRQQVEAMPRAND
jgi:PRC-barrel domain